MPMIVKPEHHQVVILDEALLGREHRITFHLGRPIQVIVESGFVSNDQILAGSSGTLQHVHCGGECRRDSCDGRVRTTSLERVHRLRLPGHTNLSLYAFDHLSRGAPQGAPASAIDSGGLRIDTDKRSVRLDGRPVELTAKEFELLAHFARSPGRVYTRAQLLDQVWGYSHSGYEHTVNSHINRLRNKIERDPANPDFIQTVWGVGYKFADRRP